MNKLSEIVKTKNRLLTLEHEGIPWLKPEGKGTFVSSPAVKDEAEKHLSRGISSLVVDLLDCTGMDSTFMGMLAGIAKTLKKQAGELRIVGASEKSRQSLTELGLHMLMTIDREDDPNHEQIRAAYRELEEVSSPGKEDHILECHENLCEIDAKNEETFKTVLEVLRTKHG